jgi:hypothetical protein
MKPLINQKFKLEKYPGKGGWTYVVIPKVFKESNAPFRWTRVKGTIDGYKIQKYHLMPMKNGKLFLPVKAAIRARIKKKEGDVVHVVLFPDKDSLEIPDELLICLEDEPSALRFFESLSDSEKKYYIQWIFGAKREETRIARMAKAINRLSRRLKMYQQEEE